LNDANEIAEVCRHGQLLQTIPILALSLSSPLAELGACTRVNNSSSRRRFLDAAFWLAT